MEGGHHHVLSASELFLETSAALINTAGGVLLVVGSLLAILNILLLSSNSLLGTRFGLINGGVEQLSFITIRLSLGSFIALSLADVIETLTQPATAYTQESLIKIAFVVAIRTVLAYFLGKELEELEKHAHEAASHAHEETVKPEEPEKKVEAVQEVTVKSKSKSKKDQ